MTVARASRMLGGIVELTKRDEMRITGHALIDIGEATLHSMASCHPDAELDTSDLLGLADWLAQYYTTKGPLQNLIRGAAFFNAGYYQPNDAIRLPFVEKVLYGWRLHPDDLLDEPCAFCDESAAYLANREQVPLLNGRGVFNFSPSGRAGLPICGRCSLAIQALPLGCLKSGGRLIAAYSDDPLLTFRLANDNVRRVMQLLSLPEVEKLPGRPFERTRFVEMLVSWLATAERRSGGAASLTAYCFTNYGASPSISIYRMDACVIRWVEAVIHHPDEAVRSAWWRAVQSNWRKPKQKQSGSVEMPNPFYEALLSLPVNAVGVLRQYILPGRSWQFATTYLEGIMQMTKEEIERIRLIGERFSVYARERRGFFYEFSREDNFASWRRKVLRAADDCSRRYDRMLISYEEFTDLFIPREDEYNNWRLIRDLITLLMLEARVNDAEDPLFEPDDEIEETEG